MKERLPQQDNPLEIKFRQLSPAVREYLLVQNALKVPTLSEGLRERLIERKCQALNGMLNTPGLPEQFRDYVMFKHNYQNGKA